MTNLQIYIGKYLKAKYNLRNTAPPNPWPINKVLEIIGIKAEPRLVESLHYCSGESLTQVERGSSNPSAEGYHDPMYLDLVFFIHKEVMLDIWNGKSVKERRNPVYKASDLIGRFAYQKIYLERETNG